VDGVDGVDEVERRSAEPNAGSEDEPYDYCEEPSITSIQGEKY
jgi:hypothetical protein